MTDALMNSTGERIIESVPEPKPKCVMLVVDMQSHIKRSKALDKVNLYIYDKEKFKYEAETLRDPDLSVENCRDLEPIGSIDNSPSMASYITFGSHLFRIGGICRTYFQFHSSQGSRTVDIIDLNCENELMVPTKGPEMKCPRIRPHLLILRGNLYVAGGFRYTNVPTEGLFFMEVLNKSGASIADWSWEPLPNPPPYVESVDDLRSSQFIAGAVESIGAIVVGFLKRRTYTLYTYQPTSSTWHLCTSYPNISLQRELHLLRFHTAVVSGEFMLWIFFPGPDEPYRSTMLYVMDLAKDNLITIDLVEKKVVPHSWNLADYYGCPPTLLKMEEREFCVCWTQCGDDPEYTCGPHTYIALHASTFTLETTGEGTLNVKPKEHYISLVPDVETLKFEDVLITDVPNSKRCNKRWTTFC